MSVNGGGDVGRVRGRSLMSLVVTALVLFGCPEYQQIEYRNLSDQEVRIVLPAPPGGQHRESIIAPLPAGGLTRNERTRCLGPNPYEHLAVVEVETEEELFRMDLTNDLICPDTRVTWDGERLSFEPWRYDE